MAVYTQLSRQEIEALLAPLTERRLGSWRGVSAGVENTTYFLTLEPNPSQPGDAFRELVLTIAEHHPLAGVEDIADWQHQLAAADLPVPGPLADAHGRCVHQLQGKPVLLVPRCRGVHPQQPSVAQCAAIGTALGGMHRVALSSAARFPSSRSLDWLTATGADVAAHLAASDPTAQEMRAALARELDWLAATHPAVSALPHGIIHGDLFRDNALFDDGRLTGVIDFFMAGTGPLLLDLAIVANDWCVHEGAPDHALTAALLIAYATTRPPTPAEQAQWPDMLRLAALRFWVSRLADLMHSEQGLPRLGKDPQPMRALLEHHRNRPQAWPAASCYPPSE